MGLAQLILPGAIAWWCRKRATDNYTVARYDNNTWYQENIQGIRTKGSRFVITNVLNVRSTPPVKERGSKYTTDNKCVMFLLYVATAVCAAASVHFSAEGETCVQQSVASNRNN